MSISNLSFEAVLKDMVIAKENEIELILQAKSRSEAHRASAYAKTQGYSSQFKLGKNKVHWYVRISFSNEAELV